VIATGTCPDTSDVPGLAPPARHAHSYLSREAAIGTREALAALRARPGPVVVGLAEGASAYGAAYRFALHVAHELGPRASVTLVTPEPFAGHLGIGGAGYASDALADALDAVGVRVETDARITEVTRDAVWLDDGRALPFALAVVTPRFVPKPVVRACDGLLGDDGFVRIDGRYQVSGRDDVFAAGAVVSIPSRAASRVRCGVPHTPSMAAEMGAIAGANAAAVTHGGRLAWRPPQDLIADRLEDGGAGENITVADPFLDPRSSAWSRVHPDLERIVLVLERMHAVMPPSSAG
jgi:sulfide:quinone oxidoreductase